MIVANVDGVLVDEALVEGIAVDALVFAVDDRAFADDTAAGSVTLAAPLPS